MENKASIRLNKYISESGICSRREADHYIEQGNVFIDGKRAKVCDQVYGGDLTDKELSGLFKMIEYSSSGAKPVNGKVKKRGRR